MLRVHATLLTILAGAAFSCSSPVLNTPPGAEDGPALPGLTADGSAGPTGNDGTTEATDAPRGPKKTEPQPLPLAEGFYPRAILRSNGTIVASVVRFLPTSQHMGATFLESTDGGVSFKEIGALDDPGNKAGLCCGTLYELPRALGAMAAGTLLWAASQGADATAPMSIPVWKSDDGGRTWAFLSKVAIATVPRKNGGLWEPEFSMTDDGVLVCHWSDETDSGHSQKLIRARSKDGVRWTDYTDTIASSTFGHRPGMPNVRHPPGQPYMLSYEICGLAGDHCTAFQRSSKDGWDWGDPKWLGNRVATPDGLNIRHAPTLAWSSAPGAAGRFFMVAQMVHQANGNVAPQNGKIILANTERGNGFWYPIAAPVPVPDAEDNFCPNYSSTILPLENGTVGLEIASRWDGKVCRSYFARSPLIDTTDGSEIADGASYRISTLIANLCLDVKNGSTAAGANVQQFGCNGSGAQRWTVRRATDGTLALQNQDNTCLTIAGNDTKPGANVEVQPCGGAGQAWKLRSVGLEYYEVMKADANVCLDVASGSTEAGGNIAQWTCTDRSPQIWRFVKL